MSLNIFLSSGGGIRIGASFGAELEGQRQGKFRPSMFNYFAGTSAGALDAALTANGWYAEEKRDLFLDTDFRKLFTPALVPFSWRKTLALQWPISLAKLAAFIDSLGLRPVENLLVNTVDAEENIQVVYCEKLPPWLNCKADEAGRFYTCRASKSGEIKKVIRWEPGAFSRFGYGKVLTRSMVLPGLVADEKRFKDGGVAENPLLSVFPANANILLMHLGYAGLVPQNGSTVPLGILAEAMYDYEFKAYSYTEHLMGHYPNLTAIYPEIYDVDSTAFDLSLASREQMIERARANTRAQWAEYQP
jgi:predicted acylesterase/phospholipase RssA